MKRTTSVALAILVLPLAFVIGRWSVPVDERTSSFSTDDAERSIIERVTTRVDGTCERELAATRQSLSIANQIIDAGIRERTGAPVAFPPGLPQQYTADGFEAAALDALNECPDSSLTLVHVDCSDFPCMAFFSQPSGSNSRGIGWLHSCEAWRDTFDNGGSANDRFMTDDGPVDFSMSAPLPTGTDLDDNAHTRWQFRLDQGRAFLMDEWGGREPTELERVEQQLEFWHDAAEDNPDRAESFSNIIADFEAKRARLIAKDGGEIE